MKIVITQNSLTRIAGSEIVTLELASFFQEKKWEVVVYTWQIGEQMRQVFQKKGIKVLTDENSPVMAGADYVWVHHQVLPRIILTELLGNEQKPTFIFNHMSSLAELYLEQPYIPMLEQKIASANLFCSQRVMDAQYKRYGDEVFNNCLLFENPAPEKFFVNLAPKKCNRVLIVSNHPPIEIKEARKILEANGVVVGTLGVQGDGYRVLSPKELKKNDCVIAIGKTVQYCLVSGVPVYVYDHFGGCGFLNEKNFEKAASFQFSGKEFGRKNAEAIVEDIVDSYGEACAYARKHRSEWRERFGLENGVKKIFSSLKKREYSITQNEVNCYLAALGIARESVVNRKNSDTAENERKMAELNFRIQDIEKSRAYRVARKIGEVRKKLAKG